MTFALDGEGYLDDEHLYPDNVPRDNNEKDEGGEEIAWEYEVGPQGRTNFDEYYEARKGKNKKQTEILEEKGRL